MRKIGLFVCLCGWAFSLFAQKVETYEYWIDTDQAKKVTGTMPADQVAKFSLDVSELPEGMHFLTFRAKDSKGQWSSPLTSFFYHQTTDGKNTIQAYEYWFDNEYDSRETGACDGLFKEALDVSALSEGIHTLHFRFQDTMGKWGNAVSQSFYHGGGTVGIEVIEELTGNAYRIPAGAKEGHFRLYDLNGRLISAEPIADLTPGEKSLRPYLDRLTAGTYILRIEVLTDEGLSAIHKKLSVR